MVTTLDTQCGEANARTNFLAKMESVRLERIPELYRDSDPSRLDPRIVSLCDEWKYAPKAKGIGFCGPTGLGKTRGIFRLLSRLMQEVQFSDRTGFALDATFVNCRIINDADFSHLVREFNSFSGAAVGAQKKLKQLCDCDVLFIDDLGQGKMSDANCSEFYHLIETRTSCYRPIFFTTNFSAQDLAERFTNFTRGAAVVRRLTEFCEIFTLNDEEP